MEEDSTIKTDYISPALEGDTVNFTCPSGFEFTGPNFSTCLENGLWLPDPIVIQCSDSKGIGCTIG